MTKQLN